MKNVEQEREITRLSAAEVLRNLVVEQRRESKDLGVTPIDVSSRRALFRSYKGTASFREVYLELMRFYLVPHTAKEDKRFKERFAGRMYQDIAHYSIVTQQPDDLTFLSPQRTLELYKNLYSADVIKQPFDQDSLGGVSVPDSVGFVNYNGRYRIKIGCEYTLSGNINVFENHVAGLQKHKEDFSTLFIPDAFHLFVVPANASLLMMDGRYSHVQFKHTPFTHKQFRDFNDGIYRDYSFNEDAATIPEIQAEAKGQLDRSVEQISNGKITPEHTLYLLNSVKNGKQFDETVALLSGL